MAGTAILVIGTPLLLLGLALVVLLSPLLLVVWLCSSGRRERDELTKAWGQPLPTAIDEGVSTDGRATLLFVHGCADSDHAGAATLARSKSGWRLALEGPQTFVLLD